MPTNRQVLVLIDFSKAFDTVDHVILARKLFCLEKPVFIIQWITSFLTDHNQATKLGFHLFCTLPINRSIIQGSGVGPALFIMFAHDLKPLDILNFPIKYADDAIIFYLLRTPRHRLNLRWLTS